MSRAWCWWQRRRAGFRQKAALRAAYQGRRVYPLALIRQELLLPNPWYWHLRQFLRWGVVESLRPAQYWRRLRWFWQRGRRGYADCDLWSFDSYLASLLAGGLRDLAQHKHGWSPDLFATPQEQAGEYRSLADWLDWYAEDCWDSLVELGGEYPARAWEQRRAEIFERLGRVWGTLWD